MHRMSYEVAKEAVVPRLSRMDFCSQGDDKSMCYGIPVSLVGNDMMSNMIAPVRSPIIKFDGPVDTNISRKNSANKRVSTAKVEVNRLRLPKLLVANLNTE